jgi:hypothetical protein
MVRHRTGDTSERSAARSFVKHLKHSTPCPRGRASPGRQRQRHKNRQGAAEFCGKNYSGKKGLKRGGLGGGAPDIVDPDDEERWERQTAFLAAFVYEMWERVRGDGKAAIGARGELQTFLLSSIDLALMVALGDGDSEAKRWACKVLADVFVRIGKHVGKVKVDKPYRKLMGIEAFVDEKKLRGKARTNVLFPGLVCAVAQGECRKAMNYRSRLILLSNAEGWERAAEAQGIPREYWAAMELPEFSVKFFAKWWGFLRPLISKKIDTAALKLLELRYKMAGKRYAKHSHKTAHDHLKTLARQRDEGIF